MHIPDEWERTPQLLQAMLMQGDLEVGGFCIYCPNYRQSVAKAVLEVTAITGDYARVKPIGAVLSFVVLRSLCIPWDNYPHPKFNRKTDHAH